MIIVRYWSILSTLGCELNNIQHHGGQLEDKKTSEIKRGHQPSEGVDRKREANLAGFSDILA